MLANQELIFPFGVDDLGHLVIHHLNGAGVESIHRIGDDDVKAGEHCGIGERGAIHKGIGDCGVSAGGGLACASCERTYAQSAQDECNQFFHICWFLSVFRLHRAYSFLSMINTDEQIKSLQKRKEYFCLRKSISGSYQIKLTQQSKKDFTLISWTNKS